MSDSWIDAPRLMPYRCHRTGQDGPESGPYFEEQFLYAEIGGYDDRELTMYHSAAWLREVCQKPGSPFEVVEPGEVEALREERDELLARVERLEEELADVSAIAAERSGLDADGLALAVAEKLSDTFALKPGRKPAAKR